MTAPNQHQSSCDLANMTATQLPKTSETQVLVSRTRELHSLYTHLTMEYLRLPLTYRRYLYGNDAMSTSEIRTIAQAKFILAATLQWKPSSNAYSVDATGRMESKEAETGETAEDELCPVWTNFFHELVEADRILCALGETTTPASETKDVVETLLSIAERKYQWLHGLASLALRGGGYAPRPSGVELTEALIFAGWNRFCFKVARGGTLADALKTTIRPTRQFNNAGKDELHSGQHNQREYFNFVPPSDFQPWLTVSPPTDNDLAGSHPQCADNSPCRRKPDFCPCKARGKECENGNCAQSGPWTWPCQPKQPPIAGFAVPSYAAGQHCVEDAGRAGELFDGVIFAKQHHAMAPLPVSPTATLATYNKSWEMLSPIDFQIPFPTPSLQLPDLLARGGLPLSEASLDTLPIVLLIELKAKAFFLSGLQVSYDIGEFPVKGAVVVPRFATFDTGRMDALLRQMLVERERWRPDSLACRTGNAGYQEPALGNDFVVAAIRVAVEDLIEHCREKLAKARRADMALK